jgi:general secretion pathway protein D
MIKKFSPWPGVLAVVLGCYLGMPTTTLAQRSTIGGGGRGGTTSGRSGSSGSSRSSGSYPANGMIGEAMISSDPETRRIIVITDDDTAASISQVITNLDRPKPQVLIKVVFLEVTYNDGSDVGLDASISRKINASNLLNASNMFSSSALGAGTLPIGAGGFYQILGQDWTVTLRAIAEAGKMEVLSRPSIMARNNQQAIITVGQRVPIITGSTVVGLTGNINNTITYEDVGIILRVTPFISSDGLVEMIVAPEISSLAGQGVSISTGTAGSSFNAPIINNRSAETVVVTPNGTPVVIGGLMENSKTDTVRKIPVIGDIPILGAVFKRKVKQDAKTELMIFLTPHIIYRPSEVAALTASERSKAPLGQKAFSEQELDRFIDALPLKKDTVPNMPTPPNAPKGKKSKSSERGGEAINN